MKRLAAVYERKGALFVIARHRTQAGFWIDDEQVDRLDRPTPEELGQAIEAALARSSKDVPTPPPTVRLDKPLLLAAKVSSWATFIKLSKHVSVSLDGDLFKIASHVNLGSKGGFEARPAITIPSSAPVSAVGERVAGLLAAPA
ncbi:MAG: hypothetical protein ACKO1O_10310 [Erythrobacter sp.]